MGVTTFPRTLSLMCNKYFYDYESGLPLRLRTDRGTENVLIAQIQASMRCQGPTAGTNSVIFGRSVGNQVDLPLLYTCYNFVKLI